MIKAKPLHIAELRVLGVAEQFCHHVEIGIRVSRLVYHVLCHFYLGVVCIIKSNAIKDRSHGSDIVRHVGPQLWVVLGAGAVPELGAVAPGDGRSSQVLPAFFPSEFILFGENK